MDISEFSKYFEDYQNKMINSLVKDYQNIGDLYLKHIEESTVKQKKEDGEPSKEM